ncbi:MAG: hypothetical protein ACJATI_001030 [Halioglobus sp.]|jgi:hypothetical protein
MNKNQIKFTFNLPTIPDWEVENSHYIVEFVNNLINNELIKDFFTLTEIIITESLWDDVHTFLSKDNPLYEKELKIKGLLYAGKIESWNNQKILFFDVRYLGTEKGVEILAELFFSHAIGNRLKRPSVIDVTKSIRDVSEGLFYSILSENHLRNYIAQIFPNSILEYESTADFTYSFKRNIKSLHYTYQKDTNNFKFVKSVVEELNRFLKRTIRFRNDNLSCDQFLSEIESIISIIDSVNVYTDDHGEVFKASILSILNKCDFDFYDAHPGTGFKVKSGPKKLFPDLADTRQSIVCFLDILGFADLIEKYDHDDSSIILKNISAALDLAVSTAFDIQSKVGDEDFKEHFEYRMFSDCIVLSIPYIDFGADFKHNFYSLANAAISFQQSMMFYGFFVRGNISVGSYYSTPNMLFSGGLVKAYKNEGPTKYPIVSLSDEVLELLSKPSEYDGYLMDMRKLIVKHSFESKGHKVFINPIYTLLEQNQIISDLDININEAFKELGAKSDRNFFSGLLENLSQQYGGKSTNESVNDAILTMKGKVQGNINNFNYKIDDEQDLDIKAGFGKVLQKYEFLILLFDWLEGNKEDNRFEYLSLASKENADL